MKWLTTQGIVTSSINNYHKILQRNISSWLFNKDCCGKNEPEEKITDYVSFFHWGGGGGTR